MRREPKEGLNGLGRWKPRETEWLWKLGIGMGMGWWLDGDCIGRLVVCGGGGVVYWVSVVLIYAYCTVYMYELDTLLYCMLI